MGEGRWVRKGPSPTHLAKGYPARAGRPAQAGTLLQREPCHPVRQRGPRWSLGGDNTPKGSSGLMTQARHLLPLLPSWTHKYHPSPLPPSPPPAPKTTSPERRHSLATPLRHRPVTVISFSGDLAAAGREQGGRRESSGKSQQADSVHTTPSKTQGWVVCPPQEGGGGAARSPHAWQTPQGPRPLQCRREWGVTPGRRCLWQY